MDFRRHKHSSLPLVKIQGKDTERVDFYEYLGVHLNNKLDLTDNTNAFYKRQSRLFLLRRLRSFRVRGAPPFLTLWWTLWWPLPSSMEWSAGVAASLLQTGRD